MSQHNLPPSIEQDERLADFAERVLADAAMRAESPLDDDLRALEETLLQIHKAIPPADLNAAAVKQMQARFKARLRREERREKQPFWKSWLTSQSGWQFATALAAITVAALWAWSQPTTSGSTSASASGSTFGLGVALAFAGVLLLAAWLSRRK